MYPNRAVLWGKLPLSVKDNFLNKTSSTLLEQLSKNATIEIPNDNILLDHISRKGIFEFLYYNRNNIKSVIPVFEKFSQLSDNNLRDYLNNFSGQINALDATQLEEADSKKTLFLILLTPLIPNPLKLIIGGLHCPECYNLLDFWTKLFSPYSGSSLSSKYYPR